MTGRVAVPSLELPIVLVAPGLGAIEAVLEDVGRRECRLRSLRFFSSGTKVRVALGERGGIHVAGTIDGYQTDGQRFTYHVSLEPLNGEADALVSLAEERRRQLAAGRCDHPGADGLHQPPLARSNKRADADFELEYRVGGEWKPATAVNLSVGGLLMRARGMLVEGMAVELRFTLPSQVLERCSDDALLAKLWDRAVREAAQAMLRRPFKMLTLRARVVCHRAIGGTIGDYGMEFYNVDPIAYGEIERYLAALHAANAAALNGTTPPS
ncbi:MAG TPA: hypothetical protein VMH02_05365 [Verrucomicrobiae bacterium]|nr:hypothetical protein [Verrucomicrobiae bacterium]